VLANNMLFMFVGWEGVGLCSYLLIGFYFLKKSASDAGKKAFIVNRIGDASFILGILLTAVTLGTVRFTSQGLPDVEGASGILQALKTAVDGHALAFGAPVLTGIALFVASMTLVQNDIKKVLAYSTISQLGYMFLVLGVCAFAAGIFHLMTHAFFKALLFLGAGSVIHAMSGEQDIRKMGGLWQKIPITARTFGVATLAIAGIFPFAGFFSKDEILGQAFDRFFLLWIIGF